VDVGFLGVVALLILAAVVVAMGERSVIVDVSMPRGPVFEVVPGAPGMMVTDVPVVVAMLGRRVGVLRFLPLTFGPLSNLRHRGVSFRIGGCLRVAA
jgi:hypothetical protein